MIELINRLTKTKMWVADERKEEYLAAGHILAADSAKPTETEEVPTKEPEEIPVKEAKKPVRKRK